MATISVSPKMKEDFDSGNLQQIVQSLVHEFVHIFLAPLQDHIQPHLSATTAPLYMKVVEEQTQRLTSVFLKTIPKTIIPKRQSGKHKPTPKNDKSGPAIHPPKPASVLIARRGRSK